MDAPQLILETLERNTGLIKMALEGLTDDDLMKRPDDQSNPLGWIVWHQTRTEDRIISGSAEKTQVWMDGKWYEKFGTEADPEISGLGETLEQVTAFRPTVESLLGYIDPVRERTRAHLSALSPADLDGEILFPGADAPRKTAEMLSILLSDYLHHCGQACYLRGCITGWGWFPM